MARGHHTVRIGLFVIVLESSVLFGTVALSVGKSIAGLIYACFVYVAGSLLELFN